jgi:hypothetical protein
MKYYFGAVTRLRAVTAVWRGQTECGSVLLNHRSAKIQVPFRKKKKIK